MRSFVFPLKLAGLDRDVAHSRLWIMKRQITSAGNCVFSPSATFVRDPTELSNTITAICQCFLAKQVNHWTCCEKHFFLHFPNFCCRLLSRSPWCGRDRWSWLVLKCSREEFKPNCLLMSMTVQVLVCFPTRWPWHPCSLWTTNPPPSFASAVHLSVTGSCGWAGLGCQWNIPEEKSPR